MSKQPVEKTLRRKNPRVSRKGPNTRVETPSEDTAEQTATFLERDRRHAKVAERAYYLAEQRGFEPGHDQEDWLSAENEVERIWSSHEREGPALCGD
jgi:hypothetical protein